MDQWIQRKAIKINKRICVYQCPADGNFRVEQEEEDIVFTNKIYLADVTFSHNTGQIYGNFCTLELIKKLRKHGKHSDGNEYFPHKIIEWTLTNGFILPAENNKRIYWAEYLDISANDTPHLIALFPNGKFEPDIPF